MRGSLSGFLVQGGNIGQRGEPGATWGAQAPWWRGQGWGRATWPPRCQVGPSSGAPFGLYLHPEAETLKRDPASRFSPLFRRRSDSKIGIARRTRPGTLPVGGLISGSFSTTMSASRMCRE